MQTTYSRPPLERSMSSRWKPDKLVFIAVSMLFLTVMIGYCFGESFPNTASPLADICRCVLHVVAKARKLSPK